MTSTLLSNLSTVYDGLSDFAESDALGQVNQVAGGGNQLLTAPELNAVVFLDAGVTDYQSLQAGVIPGIPTVILSPKEDGVAQITAFLQRNPQITRIHLVSHGAPGCLALGKGELNLGNIGEYGELLRLWPENAHILLYGCQVAAGDGGEEFIEKLHQLTGATVMASATPTGSSKWGGNWELEVIVSSAVRVQVSNIFLAFDGETLAAYEGVFALSLVGVWDRISYVDSVAVAGNYAYAVGDTLEIIDISDPSNPTFKGNYDITYGLDIQVEGGYAYVTGRVDDTEGLQIFDISNPTNPTLIGYYAGSSPQIIVVGNYTYQVGYDSGLQIINISNPTAPTLVGSYNPPIVDNEDSHVFGTGGHVVGNFAYIASNLFIDGDYKVRLHIVDISDLSNPTLVGSYISSPGMAQGVQVVGNYAYIPGWWYIDNESSGLQIVWLNLTACLILRPLLAH